MQRVLSIALAAALVAPAVPASAGQLGPDNYPTGAPASAPTAAEGPIARAALREAAGTPLWTPGEQEQKRAPAAVAGLRTAAQALPLGKKVKVTTVTGKKVKGRLVAVNETGVVIEKDEASLPVPYETMRSIEKGSGAATAIVVTCIVIGGLAIVGGIVAASDSSTKSWWGE